MKFPETIVNTNTYWEKVQNIINDENAYFFLDTNILSFFFKINQAARNELFEWIDLNQTRIKLPKHCVNEYSQRFFKNKLSDYHSLGASIKSIAKSLSSISTPMSLRADEDFAKKCDPSLNKEDFLKKFNDAVSFFDKLSKTTTEQGEYFFSIANDIKKHFENNVLDSDIFTIINECHNKYQSRFNCKVPPGYEDGNKQSNEYGDLIIWQEILEYVKNKGISKAILITMDSKRDFVYSPLKVEDENGNVKFTNDKSNFKIADPRLVSEFNSVTNSEAFYIINLYDLIEILVKKDDGQKYVNIAQAVQIATKIESTPEDHTEIIKCDRTLSDHPDDLTGAIPASQQPIRPHNIEEYQYSEFAIKDKEFDPDKDESCFSDTIKDLRMRNWHAQNPAIESIKHQYSGLCSELSKDIIFLLGRNIYQAACGSAFAAIDFIKQLPMRLETFNNYDKIHLVNGMLFEVYFDRNGELRETLKDNYLEHLTGIEDDPLIGSYYAFIRSRLDPHKKMFIFLPGDKNITLTVSKTEDEKVREINTIHGANILSTKNVYFHNRLCTDEQYSVKEIIGFLHSEYSINAQHISITIKELADDEQFYFDDHYRLRSQPFAD